MEKHSKRLEFFHEVAQVQLYHKVLQEKVPAEALKALFDCLEKLQIMQQRPILSLYKEFERAHKNERLAK